MAEAKTPPLVLNGTACPFCHGNRLAPFTAEAFDEPPKLINIMECTACEAGWQWPLQRTASQSAVVFEEAYASERQGSYFDLEKRTAVAEVQRRFTEKHTSKIGRLLDIGCGEGSFARHMAKAGWDVLGLDPAIRQPIEEQHSPGRLRIIREFVADLPSDENFDLITMWDVVEHVENPQKLIADAIDRLSVGGVLVIETGNYQSQARLQNRGGWWNFQMDHRWYFAPPQLCAILAAAGLQEIKLASEVLRPWWKGQADVRLPKWTSFAKTAVLSPWRLPTLRRTYHELAQARKRWESWGGLEIMTMTGIKRASKSTKASVPQIESGEMGA